MKTASHLLLQEQLCFPLYATSRMITRLYQPFLDKIDLTYPQYLVMLVMWQYKNQTVGDLCKQLYLNTNTITPLIKKLISKGLLTKKRSDGDERKVLVELTQKGEHLKERAEEIPLNLVSSLNFENDELLKMRELMWAFLAKFEMDRNE